MNAIVYFRKAGERTASKSLELVKQTWENVIEQDGSGKSLFFLVKEMVSDLNEKKQDFDYVVAVDGDMYVIPEKKFYIEKEISGFSKQKIWKLDFARFCKFLDYGYGLHIYNYRFVEPIWNFLKDINYDENLKRPESQTFSIICRELKLKMRHLRNSQVVCWHDYDQDFFHIFCKFYNRVGRDFSSIGKIFYSIEKKYQQTKDLDFWIAMNGILIGIRDYIDQKWKFSNFDNPILFNKWEFFKENQSFNLDKKEGWENVGF